MLKNIIFTVFILSIYSGTAQNDNRVTYSLSDCIEIALNNNLDLKSAALKAKTSEVNFHQTRNEMLPTLNGNYDLGVSNGRSIDPYTNDIINQKLTFSNAGLGLDALVFNGFRLMNSIKRDRFQLKASEMQTEEARQDLILAVTLAYIQILNGKDQVELAKSRLETTQQQLDRLHVLYKEEVGNPADYTDMQGQIAMDQMGVIIARNNQQEYVLKLLQLLNTDLDPNAQVTFDSFKGLVSSEKYPLTADQVFDESLQNLATFKSKQFQINAAIFGIKAARGNYYPNVSLFGRLNTSFSSSAQSFTETGTIVRETGEFVDINNDQYPVMRNETQFDGTSIGYADQFNNNFNSVFGVSVQIPILNGFRAKNRVALQKILKEESLIDFENTKLSFKQSIDQAYLKMESAYDRYFILQDQVKAYEESFRVNEIRFNNGVSNVVEYITSKNNLDSARLNLSNAKYEYLLRVKILDYYRGI
ncbi:TolC family protein [Flavobacteriaceae bacterium F89]|uniref:TolC family protein n=1 Tax=Cerina litoralis TaxID=2874477 RepID=A0AAE3JMN7_9FLAO|nr:TolC family protein [Cerina litoralis]MCG2460080.1 TolC family protein [Cerina litoralis]